MKKIYLLLLSCLITVCGFTQGDSWESCKVWNDTCDENYDTILLPAAQAWYELYSDVRMNVMESENESDDLFHRDFYGDEFNDFLRANNPDPDGSNFNGVQAYFVLDTTQEFHFNFALQHSNISGGTSTYFLDSAFVSDENGGHYVSKEDFDSMSGRWLDFLENVDELYPCAMVASYGFKVCTAKSAMLPIGDSLWCDDTLRLIPAARFLSGYDNSSYGLNSSYEGYLAPEIIITNQNGLLGTRFAGEGYYLDFSMPCPKICQNGSNQ